MKSEISFKLFFSIVSVVATPFILAIVFFLVHSLLINDSYAKSAPIINLQVPQNLIDSYNFKRTQNVIQTTQAKLIIPTVPVRLKIPKISVNTTFESVGLTDKGAVGIPKNFAKVAWLNLWPLPGDIGNAIITGHYGRKNGKPSVFDNLHKVRKGDKIYIEDNKGKITVFIVNKLQRYDEKDGAPDVFVSKDKKSHLVLITCEGIWNKITKSYSKRLVVFADKEE